MPRLSLAGSASGGLAPESDAAYLASAAVCAVLLAIPWLAVTIPPITDLPQQTAQVRLLGEALGEGAGVYRVQWLHPNKLGYAPLFLGWLAGGPLAAGRLGGLLIGLLWVGAIHWLARATARPVAAAALATLFFFNHLTYWGFLNFLIGLPVFVAWFVAVDRLGNGSLGRRGGPRLLLLATLLYWAHVLWLVAGLGWLVISTLFPSPPGKGSASSSPPPLGEGPGVRVLGAARGLAARLAWVAPVVVAAALWYPRLGDSGFVSELAWGRTPLERLHPGWLLNSVFGGLEGKVEPILAGAVLAWLLLGLLSGRSVVGTRPAMHRGLLLMGLAFTTAALCLPSVVQNTIFFASRWLPMAAVFLVLACAPPRLRPALRFAVPLTLVACLAVTTAAAWIEFEHDELDGLHEALAALPPEPRLLGLDFTHQSERIKGFPFYHLYAYGQVLHGGQLYRSAADLASSLVVFNNLPRQVPWTEGLDWNARKLRRSDLEHFRHLIVFASSEVHALFAADNRLTQVTADRPWRLYLIDD